MTRQALHRLVLSLAEASRRAEPLYRIAGQVWCSAGVTSEQSLPSAAALSSVEGTTFRTHHVLVDYIRDINRFMFLQVIYDQTIYEQKQCILYTPCQTLLPDIAPQELSEHNDRE